MNLLVQAIFVVVIPVISAQLVDRPWWISPETPLPEVPWRPDCRFVRCISPDCPPSQWFKLPGDCCQSCHPDICDTTLCPLPNCPVTETRPGQCCPVCVNPPKPCVYNGITYQDGETFMKDCNTCTCRNGLHQCTSMTCTRRPCTYNGVVYQDGQTFMLDCNTCTCMNGLGLCTLMICPPTTCSYMGQIYQNGETFTNDCNTCTCSRGRVVCTTRICPPSCDLVDCIPLECPDQEQITPPGECCPVCGPPSTTCSFDGRIYQNGQSIPTNDPCEFCRCSNSEVICSLVSCPQPRRCLSPFQTFPRGDVCCPDCSFPPNVAIP